MSQRRRTNRLVQERGGHVGTRIILRFTGFGLAGVGGVLAAIGLIDFLRAFTGMSSAGPGFTEHKFPSKFWMALVGLPMLGIGLQMLKAGFQRKIAQYQMREMSPAITETFDDVAAGTHDSVRQLAGAIGEGLRGDSAPVGQVCPFCQHVNSATAKFCDDCGTALARTCPTCHAANDGDAKFCNDCGAKFV